MGKGFRLSCCPGVAEGYIKTILNGLWVSLVMMIQDETNVDVVSDSGVLERRRSLAGSFPGESRSGPRCEAQGRQHPGDRMIKSTEWDCVAIQT